MGHWQDIRRAARARRADVLRGIGADAPAAALLAEAERLTQVRREPVPSGDPLLYGGVAALDVSNGVIWYDDDADPGLVAFFQAHEYAHLWLGNGHVACEGAEVDAEAPEEPVPLGVRRVEGYGPDERREREANVFAREFLLPTDVIHRWYLEEGLDAPTIAGRVGVPEGMVLHQLSRALLTPEITDTPSAEEEPVGTALDLDDSQREAAQADVGPVLVEAGPGTGKTRTLVGRVLFLLDDGVPPSSILTLTFSNKAAEEMRSRVAGVAPEAAPQIWTGTFHAFGLELMRKYGTLVGLPPKPEVLDPIESMFLLERYLPDLELNYYQNLPEPAMNLRHIVGAISRAKDELIGPVEYARLAGGMRLAAETEKEVERAEKAREVAQVYALYQELLEAEGLLDFGDLISRSVELLRMRPDVRDLVRETHVHVLVDEYQDVNRAGGVLLREIAGAGEGLWAVGDARQAIYRFRGAAPRNVRLFREDFAGARVLALGRNYRSQPAILDVYSEMAPGMLTSRGRAFTPWQPHRVDSGGKVMMEVAEDAQSEGAGLAREIERQRAAGVPYSEQAVLCRSHTGLAHIAAELERAGVPVLYLGDLFEREEVRDMLSLISLACEGDGRGLVRAAGFDEYRVPLDDVRTLVSLAKEEGVPFPRALGLALDEEAISEEGKRGLALLGEHLDGLCYGSSAWGMLVRYLYARSSYVRRMAEDGTAAGHQRRLGLFQFLQFAYEHRGNPADEGEDPKRAFLRYVRRLEMFNEEKQFRQVPDWAAGIDAVRLMTVHASKGLEFRAVYLPRLRSGEFPASRRGERCPPPDGMLPAGEEDGHEEEEECLFFVALSRARDVLCLSRPRRHGDRNSNPSTLLDPIRARLPRPPDGEVTWEGVPAEPAPAMPAPPSDLPTYTVGELDVYIKCPRKYFYESVVGLSSGREDSAYGSFHRCVYGLLRWMREERDAGRDVDENSALGRLRELWNSRGPVGHPYEEIYRRNAEKMAALAVGLFSESAQGGASPEWEVILEYGRVKLVPDHVEPPGETEDAPPLVRRIRTGRPSSGEARKDLYALYQKAADEAYPETEPRIERLYLSTGETEDARIGRASTMNGRIKNYDKAMAGIQQGDFTAKPNDHECPRCSHYFICPAGQTS